MIGVVQSYSLDTLDSCGGFLFFLDQHAHIIVLVVKHLLVPVIDAVRHVAIDFILVLVGQTELLVQLSERLVLPQNVFICVEGQSLAVLVLDDRVVLLDLQPLLLEHALVNIKDFSGLPAELQLLELESGLDEHEDGHFGFERKPVPRQVVPVDSLFKLPDLLRAEGKHLQER